MDLKLKGKNAIVLAGSKGLGFSVVQNLLSEGCNVYFCSRGEENVANALDELKNSSSSGTVKGITADVSDPQELKNFLDTAIEELKDIDILVTNAGGPPPGVFDDFQDDAWYGAFELNFLSAVRAIREVLPGMKKQKSGKIIGITSIAVKMPVKNLILSNAIRAGVTGLYKSLANELAPFNIQVNTVCPGIIFTDRVKQLTENEAKLSGLSVEEVVKKWENEIPVGKLGTPDEFGALVAFLASGKSGYINGTAFWIDGGKYPGLL